MRLTTYATTIAPATHTTTITPSTTSTIPAMHPGPQLFFSFSTNVPKVRRNLVLAVIRLMLEGVELLAGGSVALGVVVGMGGRVGLGACVTWVTAYENQ